MGPHALDVTDFTARQDLTGLEPASDVFVRVTFQSLDNDRAISEPVTGRIVVPPEPLTGEGHMLGHARTDLRFQWSGDTAGQGWGINPAFGGMRIYETMRQRNPLFFIHSGDTIYADGPIASSVVAENGLVWNNIVTPEVAKVAETLDEFRGRYRYNLLDENVRRFNAEVPQIWQWDDHEVTNNWSDSKDLSGDGALHREERPAAHRARHAGISRVRADAATSTWASRSASTARYGYGPLLDLFVIDMRSYRGPNTANLQTMPERRDGVPRPRAARLAEGWPGELARGLEGDRRGHAAGPERRRRRAAHGQARWEAVANGEPGGPKGRELEIAELLSHLKRQHVHNVVWLTADVHYCAAHYYDPARAAFRDFDGFWEFVSGPLNAGTFGPNSLDGTFGPQVVFVKAPPPGRSNLSPYSGLQFFGEVNIASQGEEMTVDLRDINAVSVFSRTLQPRRG